MIGPLSFLSNDNRAPRAQRRSERAVDRAEALEPAVPALIKSHHCRLRLSHSIPFPGYAGAGGARSRAISDRISWNI